MLLIPGRSEIICHLLYIIIYLYQGSKLYCETNLNMLIAILSTNLSFFMNFSNIICRCFSVLFPLFDYFHLCVE